MVAIYSFTSKCTQHFFYQNSFFSILLTEFKHVSQFYNSQHLAQLTLLLTHHTSSFTTRFSIPFDEKWRAELFSVCHFSSFTRHTFLITKRKSNKSFTSSSALSETWIELYFFSYNEVVHLSRFSSSNSTVAALFTQIFQSKIYLVNASRGFLGFREFKLCK